MRDASQYLDCLHLQPFQPIRIFFMIMKEFFYFIVLGFTYWHFWIIAPLFCEGRRRRRSKLETQCSRQICTLYCSQCNDYQLPSVITKLKYVSKGETATLKPSISLFLSRCQMIVCPSINACLLCIWDTPWVKLNASCMSKWNYCFLT